MVWESCFEKEELPCKSGLPSLVGSARLSASSHVRPATHSGLRSKAWTSTNSGSAQRAWRSAGAAPLSARAAQSQAVESQRCKSAPSSDVKQCATAIKPDSKRQHAMQILQWVENELSINGLQDCGPCFERVRIFLNALGELIDMLPSYRPFLLMLRKEYEGLVENMQEQFSAFLPMEGRVKTLRAESYSFLGESMTWFQTEIKQLRQKVEALERENHALLQGKAEAEARVQSLEDIAQTYKAKAAEGTDNARELITRMERMEKTIDTMKSVEMDVRAIVKESDETVKALQNRNYSLEEQLKSVRNKLQGMVPKEDLESAKEEIKQAQLRHQELADRYAAKQKDYVNIVNAYSKKSGQRLVMVTRPLTPRPEWELCEGIGWTIGGDPMCQGTSDRKLQVLQEIFQRTISRSRMLLSEYGANALEMASVLEMGSRPLVVPPTNEKASMQASQDPTIAPDVDECTPVVLRHPAPVRSLGLTRTSIVEFMLNVMQHRLKEPSDISFIDFMMQFVRDRMPAEDATVFAINLYSGVKRFSAEPEFLAYLLLILGKIPDHVVLDNQSLCRELCVLLGCGDLNRKAKPMAMAKQELMDGLRLVMRFKDPKRWLQIHRCLPAGEDDALLNVSWLLNDDLYIISPLVYALRLQHLDEAVELFTRFEVLMTENLKGDELFVVEAFQAAVMQDFRLSQLCPEEFSREFSALLQELGENVQGLVKKFVWRIRQGGFCRALFFPKDPSDELKMSFGTSRSTD